ncbi:MAG TPA: TlpA disulfide reductase family protein [Bryobacteraceae bacterium]|jgi:peroxiredoxin|nr:TlpA disulfide reductase family protein [Bryobacteraceae bacterium]
MIAAGSVAPEFTLDRMGGGRQSLKEILKRGPVLLAFYKISCPVCQLTLPFLDRIAAGSLPVIAISQDDENGTAKFQERFKVALPTLLDRERDHYPASNAFGISHVPSLFLIEKDGRVSLAVDGFSKRDLEALGARAGVAPFRGENVPEWKAG